jgi:hypothetical protein
MATQKLRLIDPFITRFSKYYQYQLSRLNNFNTVG